MRGTKNIYQEEDNIKRPLFWITGALVLGEVLAYGIYRTAESTGILGVVTVFLFLLIIAAAFLLFYQERFKAGPVRVFIYRAGLIVLFGVLHMTAELRPHPAERLLEVNPDRAVMEGRLEKASFKNGYYSLVLRDVKALMSDKEYVFSGVLVSAEQKCLERSMGAKEVPAQGLSLNPGIRFQLSGELSLIAGARNPGEFDYRLYYCSQELRFRLKAEEVRLVCGDYPPLSGWTTAFKDYVSRALAFLCAAEDRGIYEAVLLGNKAELADDIRQLYQRSGIAHLLAVSGLHVSLIGLGLYKGLGTLGMGNKAAGILASCILFFYGSVTGFGPSVFRAVFMILCSFLAVSIGRTYDLLSAMSLSLLLLVLDSPFLLFTSGLQLSFGAVLTIGIAAERSREWKRRESEASVLSQGVFASLMIQIFTYPVILYHFFEFPLYGFFLNFIAIPLMTWVVTSGIVSVAVLCLPQLFTMILPAMVLRVTAQLAVGAMGTGHYILALYSVLCRLASGLPFYSIIGGRPDIWKIFLYYGIVIFMLYWKRGDGKIQKRRFLSVSIAVMLLLSLRPVGGFQITFLDVGQGDGIFLQTRGYNILVDCGSSQNKNVGKSCLIPFLKSKGVSRLDFVFVSHGDLDHINGIEYLLQQDTGIRVENLVLSQISREEESCRRLAKLSSLQGGETLYMETGQQLRFGELSLTCVYPSPATRAANKNEQSLVLLAEYGNHSFLLTGDIEEEGEEEIIEDGARFLPERITVLKAAHHGSKGSGKEEILKRLRPEIAVLSYGNRNSYGHPSKETVERLKQIGAELWRTGESGAIEIETDGKTMRIKGFADGIFKIHRQKDMR